jgi:hypothetical protein
MHQNRGRERREEPSSPALQSALRSGAFAAEHLRCAGFDLRGGTGVGNRQPQKEPHGVAPERLFNCDVTRTLAASGLWLRRLI